MPMLSQHVLGVRAHAANLHRDAEHERKGAKCYPRCRCPRRMKDVGKPKAEVAAERVMARVAGVAVTPHFCRIEDKLLDFYAQFHVIILGLDSLEARRFMNQVACSFLGARQALRGVHAGRVGYTEVAARRRPLLL